VDVNRRPVFQHDTASSAEDCGAADSGSGVKIVDARNVASFRPRGLNNAAWQPRSLTRYPSGRKAFTVRDIRVVFRPLVTILIRPSAWKTISSWPSARTEMDCARSSGCDNLRPPPGLRATKYRQSASRMVLSADMITNMPLLVNTILACSVKACKSFRRNRQGGLDRTAKLSATRDLRR